MKKSSQSTGWDNYLEEESRPLSPVERVFRVILLVVWFPIVIVPWVVVYMLAPVTHLEILWKIDQWLDDITSKIAGL